MGRKYLYYPLAEISPHKIAIPGEFVFEDTLEPYDGPYVTAKGQFLSGTTITRDSRLLKIRLETQELSVKEIILKPIIIFILFKI